MNTILIVNGILVDPAIGLHRRGNLFIQDGSIVEITSSAPPADQTLDVHEAFVCPGFVDMHVHFREPGFEHKETIRSGLQAAVRGGFTAVATMPNTRPVCDSPEVLRFILERAREVRLAEVLPICAITRDARGTELADMAGVAALGCRAFSNDGQPVEDAATMLRAAEAVKRLGGLIIDHAEDKSLAGAGVMHAGPQAANWNLPGITPLAEEVHIARDVLLAEETGCPFHIAHLSTSRGLELVRWGKMRRAPVSAEVTPHHLCLAAEDMTGPDPNFKMNPPLRPRRDLLALRDGLAGGLVDAIATDHAPHAEEEKKRGFLQAPFGIVGLESAVPLILDQFTRTGLLRIEQVVEVFAIRPARLLGAAPRSLAPGTPANLTILDPRVETIIHPEQFASQSRNTPFSGWRLRGAVRATVVGGAIVYQQTF